MVVVKTVTFDIKKEERASFEANLREEIAVLANWDGCLSSEIWVSEKKDSVVFTSVSKWKDEDGFKGWLKGTDHAKKQRAAQQSRGGASPVISRTVAQYDLLENTSD